MRLTAVIWVGVALAFSGCGRGSAEDQPLSAKVGKMCTVQFRRGDGLGAAGTLPVGPTTGSINGAEVSLHGKLVAVEEGWVTIASGAVIYCVNQESILLIEFRK